MLTVVASAGVAGAWDVRTSTGVRAGAWHVGASAGVRTGAWHVGASAGAGVAGAGMASAGVGGTVDVAGGSLLSLVTACTLQIVCEAFDREINGGKGGATRQ